MCVHEHRDKAEVIIKLKPPSTSQLSVLEKNSWFKCRVIYHLSKSRIPVTRCEESSSNLSQREQWYKHLLASPAKPLTQKEKILKRKFSKDAGKIPTIVPCECLAQSIPQHCLQNHLLNSVPFHGMPSGAGTHARAGAMHSEQPVQQQQHTAARLRGEQGSSHLQEPKSKAGLCSALHYTASKFPRQTACQQKAWCSGGVQTFREKSMPNDVIDTSKDVLAPCRGKVFIPLQDQAHGRIS